MSRPTNDPKDYYIGLRINEETNKKLIEISRKKGISVAEYVRSLINPETDKPMTKQQAIDLEKECDKIFSDAIGWECTVAVSLNGRLQIYFNDNLIGFCGDDFDKPSYIKFYGGYDMLQEYITKLQHAIRQNKDKIKLLMQSYKEHSC